MKSKHKKNPQWMTTQLMKPLEKIFHVSMLSLIKLQGPENTSWITSDSGGLYFITVQGHTSRESTKLLVTCPPSVPAQPDKSVGCWYPTPQPPPPTSLCPTLPATQYLSLRILLLSRLQLLLEFEGLEPSAFGHPDWLLLSNHPDWLLPFPHWKIGKITISTS